MASIEVPLLYVIGLLTVVVFVVFLVLITIEYRKRQLRHITEQLQMKHRYQQELLQTRLEVQEQSFRYISEEIHDNIAQLLSLARLKLYRVVEKNTDDTLSAGLDSGIGLLGNALDGLRNLSHVLNGGMVASLSLSQSIEKELGYIAGVKEMQTDFSLLGNEYEPGPETKLMAFRIVQEAIGNALKHAAATRIAVDLVYEAGRITIRVTDNGKGFDRNGYVSNNGLGLRNMEQRAALVGNLDIQSETGIGTTITLNISTNNETEN